jgi:outer membrane protein assembly factor BamB
MYTGAKLRSYHTGNYGLSSPALANGVVYIGSGNHNDYALNAMCLLGDIGITRLLN